MIAAAKLTRETARSLLTATASLKLGLDHIQRTCDDRTGQSSSSTGQEGFNSFEPDDLTVRMPVAERDPHPRVCFVYSTPTLLMLSGVLDGNGNGRRRRVPSLSSAELDGSGRVQYVFVQRAQSVLDEVR